MSQPIDTAYVEVRPDVDRFATMLAQTLTRTLSQVQTAVDQRMRGLSETARVAGERMGQALGDGVSRGTDGRLRDARGRFLSEGGAAGRAFGDGFTRDANGRLRDARGRFVAEGARVGAGLLSGLAGSLTQLGSSLVSNVGNAISNLTPGLLGLIPVALGAAAGLAAIVPAAYALGGALGSLPGLISGVGAVIATLGLGLGGLADHFKSTAKGAGGAGGAVADNSRAIAAAERQIVLAERRLADAQRDRLKVQNAVNEATLEAQERIEDLNRSLRRARLDEQQATDDAAKALEAYNFALESGDPESIEQARRALEDANLTVEEAKDRTEDLAREKAESDRKGVQGSDEVTAALEKQRDATLAVQDAQYELADAQKALRDAQKGPGGGGGGGIGQDLAKIAPAAAAFVKQVKALGPAFTSLRLHVQQKLFAGLDKTVKSLATAWFPQLKISLGGYADTLNRIAKNLGKSLIKPEFIKNMAAGLESFRKLLERVGMAVTGPLVDAFGQLSRAAGPFIEQLGDEIGSLIEDFSAWIAMGDKTGGLDSFFERARFVLHDLVSIGRDVASIIGSIIKIFIGEEATTNAPFRNIKQSLDDLADWFADPKNQQKVRDWIGSVEDFVTWFFTEGIPKIKGFIGTVQGWVVQVELWIGRIRYWRDQITSAFTSITNVVRTSMGIARSAILGVLAPVEMARTAFSRLRDSAASAVSQTGSVLSSLPGRVRGAIGSLRGMLFNAGQDVVRGLWDGISSLGPWLARKVGEWVKQHIPAPIRFALDSRSPSRVTAEIGRDVARGVQIGMDDQASTVEAASRRLALAAVPSAAQADVTIGRVQALTSPTTVGGSAAAGAASTSGIGSAAVLAELAAMRALLVQIAAQDPSFDVHAYLGTREIEDVVDTRIARKDRASARKLAATPRTV